MGVPLCLPPGLFLYWLSSANAMVGRVVLNYMIFLQLFPVHYHHQYDHEQCN